MNYDNKINQIESSGAEKTRVPVYRHPASYALEHGEFELYRQSYTENVGCRDAIEQAIHGRYRDNRLGKEVASEVIEQYGMERVQYVLAATIQARSWDGRLSRDNKYWAGKISVCENTDPWGQDRNAYFMVDHVHPGLLDLFTTQVRDYPEKQNRSRTSVMARLQKHARDQGHVTRERQDER